MKTALARRTGVARASRLLVLLLGLPLAWSAVGCSYRAEIAEVEAPESTSMLSLRSEEGIAGWEILATLECEGGFRAEASAVFVEREAGPRAEAQISQVPAGTCTLEVQLFDAEGGPIPYCLSHVQELEVPAGVTVPVEVTLACSEEEPSEVEVSVQVCWRSRLGLPEFTPDHRVAVHGSTRVSFQPSESEEPWSLGLSVADPELEDIVAIEPLGPASFEVTCLDKGPADQGGRVPLNAILDQCGVAMVAQQLYVICDSAELQLPDPLVLYTFEEDFLSTGQVLDHSGNGVHALPQGPIDAAEGVFGQGIAFTGRRGSYLQAASNPIAGRTDLSVALWFRTDDPSANYKLVCAAEWFGGLNASGLCVNTHISEVWADDQQPFYAHENRVNNDNGFLVGEWNHMVVTYDGEFFREYTNGALINEWPTVGLGIGRGRNLAVGTWPQHGFNFEGSMDEVQIYDRALTGDEVLGLYEAGLR